MSSPKLEEAREMIEKAQFNCALKLLLTDMELLPEQIEEGSKDWKRMLVLIYFWEDNVSRV